MVQSRLYDAGIMIRATGSTLLAGAFFLLPVMAFAQTNPSAELERAAVAAIDSGL
jgi:hypothetical protein